jgi:hypothetical protein
MGVIGQPLFFGGGGLSFEVLGGTTEPTPTKDYAIWVNTPVEITSYSFNLFTPEGDMTMDPLGHVRFRIGASDNEYSIHTDEENFYEDNIILLAPISCQQVNEEFVYEARPFKLWRNGVWNDPGNLWLYKGDDEIDAFPYLPGGLQYGVHIYQGPDNGTNNYRMMSNKLRWSTLHTTGNSFNFNPPIDLTPYNYVCFDMQCVTRKDDGMTVEVGVDPTPVTDNAHPGGFAASISKIWNTKRQTYRVDISALSGPHYVKLSGYGTAGDIFNCWLE